MILVRDILKRSATFLNDSVQTIFTDAFQLPYFQTAYAELSELMQANNVPITDEVSDTLTIAVGVTNIGGAGGPALPTDLVEIRNLYERTTGTNETFGRMIRVDFLPQYNAAMSALIYWAWQNQIIEFLPVGATTERDIQIQYTANRLSPVESADSFVKAIGVDTFLAYRTAALCADFQGENPSRAEKLNYMAQLAVDRYMQINVKGRQSIFTRRRPFRAGYKSNQNIL